MSEGLLHGPLTVSEDAGTRFIRRIKPADNLPGDAPTAEDYVNRNWKTITICVPAYIHCLAPKIDNCIITQKLSNLNHHTPLFLSYVQVLFKWPC